MKHKLAFVCSSRNKGKIQAQEEYSEQEIITMLEQSTHKTSSIEYGYPDSDDNFKTP